MSGIRQAVILAGGRGERLRPLTDTIPKPMVAIHGRPFLEYLVELLKENGIEEVVLLLGYLPEKIREHFSDGLQFGVKIRYSVGALYDKTGTRLRNAGDILDERFLLLYCDNYWPLNAEKLLAFHGAKPALATVTVYVNKDGFTRNNVYVDEEGYVTRYDPERKDMNLNGVDIGFFVIDKRVLELMPGHNFSFEKEILPVLISSHSLRGYRTDHRYCSIGRRERFSETERFLQPRKVVLLDRDGVINERPGKARYVRGWGEFRFLPAARAALRLLSQNDYEIYIISNQAGIARGVMSEEDLGDIHHQMLGELAKDGVRIAGIYYCPHDWDRGCECRKPKPGMLFQASREHQFDLTKAVFIGDDERDREAGEAAGCKTILVDKNRDFLRVVREEILV